MASPAPLVPSPDRAAAGDQAFDPTVHRWVDGVWWSPDGRFRWNGHEWRTEPARPQDASAEPASVDLSAGSSQSFAVRNSALIAGLVTAAVAVGLQIVGQVTQGCPANDWAQGPVLLVVLIGGTITVTLAWLVNRVGCLASFALGVCLVLILAFVAIAELVVGMGSCGGGNVL